MQYVYAFQYFQVNLRSIYRIVTVKLSVEHAARMPQLSAFWMGQTIFHLRDFELKEELVKNAPFLDGVTHTIKNRLYPQGKINVDLEVVSHL